MTDVLQCWHRGYYIEVWRDDGWTVKDITGRIVWSYMEDPIDGPPTVVLEIVVENLRSQVNREILRHPFTFKFSGRPH